MTTSAAKSSNEATSVPVRSGFVGVDDARPVEVPLPVGVAPLSGPRCVVNRDFFGATLSRGPGPQAFLVDGLPPGTTIGAHFHPVDQFQLFTGAPAGAFYRRAPMEDVMLHYADAYSTYGPFGTTAAPLSFFTLRPQSSAFTGYMPGSRDRLVRRGRRNYHVGLSELCRGDLPEGLEVVPVVPAESDGLAAALFTAGPHHQLVADLPTPSGGAYWYVLEGDVEFDGRRFGPRSLGWFAPNEHPATMSGPEGARVLVMQFPVSIDEPSTEADEVGAPGALNGEQRRRPEVSQLIDPTGHCRGRSS